ncbi:MAG: hypothetical protein ABSA11_06635 [Candidatus Bathyarchaeia archaeon]
MVHVVVYERVKDHARWLKTFDGDAPHRNGSKGGVILQFEKDHNKHHIVFEWSDEEANDFVDFVKTPEMQKVFTEAGVLEQTIQVCSPSTIFSK